MPRSPRATMTPSVSFRISSKLFMPLLVLDLRNDLNFLTLATEDASNMLDVVSSSDEGGKDHVHAILDTKLQVGLIFLRKGWEIDIGSWKVDALPGGDLAVVESFDAQRLVVDNLEDFERLNTIVDVDQLASTNDFGDVLVVNVAAQELAC